MKRLACFWLMILVLCSTGLSRTWYIRPDGTGEAGTISAGVDSAASGDTLLLADGVFTGADNENISIFGMDLDIISESGHPNSCVIDCGGSGNGISYEGWPGMGFGSGTVKGLKITRAGTAIEAWVAASASVVNCLLAGNSGYVVSAMGSPSHGYGSVGLTDCIISSNPSVAISCSYKCGAYASGCIFYNNGPVLRVEDLASGTLTRCTIVANSGGAGGVIRGVGTTSGMITVDNSIVASNSGQAVVCGGGSATIECTDIWGNSGGDYVGCIAGKNGVNGNFSADPRLCDPAGGDFALQLNSPCAPGNHPAGADCGVIGAKEPGCGNPTDATTWGSIKAQFGD